jgi:hypothetical protein
MKRDGKGRGMMMMRPAAMGTVTAINGSTITVSGRLGMGGENQTSDTPKVTLTINASGASIMKNNATSSVSAILVGDTLFVQGTTNGTVITATMIRDGAMMRGGRSGKRDDGEDATSTLIQGNGQPVIAGTITAVNGTSITVTNRSNVTYTVDVSTGKIVKSGAVGTVSSLLVGDMAIVQGAVNGTTITASSVMDNGVAKTPTANTGNEEGMGQSKPASRGLFGGLGSFFSHLFGF